MDTLLMAAPTSMARSSSEGAASLHSHLDAYKMANMHYLYDIIVT